jgi:hypothetical protein
MLLNSQQIHVKRSALMGRALQEKLKERLEEKEKKARMLAASATTFDDSAIYAAAHAEEEEFEDLTNFTRDKLKEFIESRFFEYTILLLVVIYVLVVFVLIIIDDPEYKCEQALEPIKYAINIIDVTILIIFGIEIVLNVLVNGMGYLKDVLLSFDAVVVFVSLVLAIIDLSDSGVDGQSDCPQPGQEGAPVADGGASQAWSNMRGALRLLRIVIVFRKIASAEKLIEKSRHGEKLQITSPAERVLRLLNQLKDNRVLPYAVRREIEYAIQKVSSNKLYEPIVEAEGGQEEGKEEYSGWITQGYKHERRKENKSDKQQDSRPSVSSVQGDENSAKGTKNVDGERRSNWHILDTASADVHRVLEKVSRLDFDVIEMESLTGLEALPITSCFAMDKHRILDDLGMNKPNWEYFVRKIAGGYLASNSYHNATHAADVLQSSCWLLFGADLRNITGLDTLECFALMFAASIHDYEHPGTSNPFLTKTGHKLAVIYNDHNVLEMHHVAASYKLVHDTKMELFLFKDISDGDYSRIREITISAVLATDYTNHFKDLGLLRSLTSRGDFLQPKDGEGLALNKDDRMLILNVGLHTCDVSNPAKALSTYVTWAERVLTEFFGQGEKEKEYGLPVSNFMDKETTNIAKCQIGFINVLVNPLFLALHEFLNLQPCLDNLSKNRQFWEENVTAMEIEMLSGRQEFPSVKGR